MMGDKSDRLYRITVGSTVAIAALGFIFSYITLWQVAGVLKMNWVQALIFPLLLDLFMIVAHLAYFYLSKIGAAQKDRNWAAVAMCLTVGLSVLFNVSHVWTWPGNTNDVLKIVAWALPPVILLLSVKTITVMVRTHDQPITDLSTPYQEIEKPINAKPVIAIEPQVAKPKMQTCKYCGDKVANPGAHVRHHCKLAPQRAKVDANGKTQ